MRVALQLLAIASSEVYGAAGVTGEAKTCTITVGTCGLHMVGSLVRKVSSSNARASQMFSNDS